MLYIGEKGKLNTIIPIPILYYYAKFSMCIFTKHVNNLTYLNRTIRKGIHQHDCGNILKFRNLNKIFFFISEIAMKTKRFCNLLYYLLAIMGMADIYIFSICKSNKLFVQNSNQYTKSANVTLTLGGAVVKAKVYNNNNNCKLNIRQQCDLVPWRCRTQGQSSTHIQCQHI